LLAGSRPVVAQDPQPTPSDDEVNRVAKQMYCPVCENIPLDVCPTQACHDWRELIRQKLAAGWSDQQIKDYFAKNYGDRVLAEPPASGLNWLVYILPWVAFMAGVLIVARVIVSMRKKTPAATGIIGSDPAIAKNMDDPYLQKLEEELRKKESK
jgi:cytochrome c-type biogenesis protein CcmH